MLTLEQELFILKERHARGEITHQEHSDAVRIALGEPPRVNTKLAAQQDRTAKLERAVAELKQGLIELRPRMTGTNSDMAARVARLETVAGTLSMILARNSPGMNVEQGIAIIARIEKLEAIVGGQR